MAAALRALEALRAPGSRVHRQKQGTEGEVHKQQQQAKLASLASQTKGPQILDPTFGGLAAAPPAAPSVPVDWITLWAMC